MAQPNTCAACKFGYDKKPGGGKPPRGTVWCGKRSVGMGINRKMSCFVAFAGVAQNTCGKCKWARFQQATGETPKTGHMWCEKRHFETPRQRRMDCFER